MPGDRCKELVPGAQGAYLDAGDLFHLKFVVVVVKPGVQAQELQLCTGTVTGGRIQYVVIGRPDGQLREFVVGLLAGTEAQAKGVMPLIVADLRFRNVWKFCRILNLAAGDQ